jgi:hypothetical protein
MGDCHPSTKGPVTIMAFRGAIFDVDGVLVDSPHELAWRESLRMLMEGEWRDICDQTSWAAERFTPSVYQQVMAGMPRMAGACAAMPTSRAGTSPRASPTRRSHSPRPPARGLPGEPAMTSDAVRRELLRWLAA